jgi:hypothetical protein
VEIEILYASLVLVACISAGISCIYIARSRSVINKHSRQRIKDFENDIGYLAQSKKDSDKQHREDIRSLQQALNRSKRGETVTDTDMKNSGLGEVIMQLIPNKYRKAASFLVPQVEEAVKKDPAIVERIYEKIKSANTSNKQAEPGTEAEAVSSL